MAKRKQVVKPTVKASELWPRITEALGTDRTGEIAEIVNISAASVSDWKHKGKLPRIEHLIAISNFKNISLDWLLTGRGPVNRPKVEEEGLLKVLRDQKLIPGPGLGERSVLVSLQQRYAEKLLDICSLDGTSPADKTTEFFIKGMIADGVLADRNTALQIKYMPHHFPQMASVLLSGEIVAGEPLHIFEQQKEKVLVAETFKEQSRRLLVLRVRDNWMLGDEYLEDGDLVICSKSIEATNGDTVVALIDGKRTLVKTFHREGDLVTLRSANLALPHLLLAAERVEILATVLGTQRVMS